MLLQNVATFLFEVDCLRVTTRLVCFYGVGRYEVHKSKQGYWINVWWPCGVTAPLTYRELEIIENDLL